MSMMFEHWLLTVYSWRQVSESGVLNAPPGLILTVGKLFYHGNCQHEVYGTDAY